MPSEQLAALKQLHGKLKFDELIEIEPMRWRGTNKASDFIIEINILPVLDIRYPVVLSFAIAEREMQLEQNTYFFPVEDMFTDIQFVLNTLQWEAKSIWYFDDENN